MFSKAFAIASILLATSLQVNAHAAVSPVLGLAADPVRSDVKRPNARTPCGRNVDIASTVDTSTPVQAAADGTFTMTATNFNRRLDGSRQFTALADATATGNSMTTKVTMVKNGDPRPAQLGSEQVVAQLPAGTQCTGGASGNLCLVQFKSLSGFGNCVVVQQGGAAAASTGTDTNTTATDAGTGTGTNTNATATNAGTGTGTDTNATATNAGTGTGTDTNATATDAGTATADTGAASTTPAAASTSTKKNGGLGGLAGLTKLFQRHNIGGTRAARRFIEAVDMLESREVEDEDIMDIVGRDMWDLLMDLE